MNKSAKDILILIGLSYFFFIIGNGSLSLSNPDEVFYAQTAKEMASRGEWLTPILFDKPQFEKPIFLYWLLRVAFFAFGVTSFATRFFPAVFALGGVLGIYLLGLIGFKDRQKAFIASLILMSCGLYIGLARTLFTDMIFSVFIFFSLLSFFWGYSHRTRKSAAIILFFFFSGLAVLTKGPLGFSIPFLIVMLFLALKRELPFFFSKTFICGFLTFILLSFPWYIFMIKKYGPAFTYEFFYNDHLRRFLEAEHNSSDKWYFYPFSIIGSFFPWSIFMLASLPRFFKKKLKDSPIYIFLICWIAVTFIIFQSAHSKLVSYVLPLFPALALVTGDFIAERISKKEDSGRNKGMFLLNWGGFSLLPIGIIIAIFKFAGFISSYIPVFVFITTFAVWLLVMLAFILKGKFLKTVYLLTSTIPLFFLIIPFVKNDIEPYISSRSICLYMKENYPTEEIILASKPYVRGVRYYTGNKVAAFAPYCKNFFSPHPIPFLDSDEKAADFINRRPFTYCFLEKGRLGDMERVARAYGFKITVLKTAGYVYLLKVNPVRN